ncbi:hypothetical protein Tco_0671487 [Tanacetum coccineum]
MVRWWSAAVDHHWPLLTVAVTTELTRGPVVGGGQHGVAGTRYCTRQYQVAAVGQFKCERSSELCQSSEAWSGTRSECMDLCQSLAIMRRLVNAFKDHSEIVVNSNDDDTSSDDDDFEDIEYVEASPPDLEIVSLEEVNDVDQEKEEFDLEKFFKSKTSFSLDHFDDPSLPRPPPEPPDVEICFNFEPDAGVVTKKVVGDISEHDVLMPNLLPTQPTLCPVFDLLLPFSSENEDKVFKPGIFSSPFSSHRAKITFDFSERPMMISGGDIPHLDVPYLHFYPP